MDRILEKKPFIIRYRNYLIAGVVFLAFLIYVVVNSMGGRKLRTEADKLSVETVRQDKFLEYVDAEGIVQPILTLKVNTREGGSVDKIIGEEGVMLEKGDTILILTNPELIRSIDDQRDDLDKQTGQNLSDMEEHKYPLTLRKAYKYYRLNMSNYASSMCSLSHFNLLGYDAKDVVTPTPAPTEPPSPTPSPSPAPTGKPDGGGDTNNFWNIFIGGGSDDGTDGDHKGIFWALVSLILALIAFFTNLFAGVAYLFPFLPEGVVMTINTCLFVVFLFVIIKFIMRSK